MAEHLRRGDIVKVRLDPIESSEQSGVRPAVVLSPDLINANSPVIFVAPLTTKKTDHLFPFEALLTPHPGGVPMISKALLMQMRSIDKRRVVSSIGKASPAELQQIDKAIQIAAGLQRL